MEHQISDIIEFKRTQIYLHKDNIECDYWEYLDHKTMNYAGEFLLSYDWSIDFQSELDTIQLNQDYLLKTK